MKVILPVIMFIIVIAIMELTNYWEVQKIIHSLIMAQKTEILIIMVLLLMIITVMKVN